MSQSSAMRFLATVPVGCLVRAIRWFARFASFQVQQNARAFGGDPDRVTIFGESSGGAVVAFHLTRSV